MDRLRKLLDAALTGPLTDEELDEVAALAVSGRLIEVAVRDLILGGTEALVNLRRASALRHAHADFMSKQRLWSPRRPPWRISTPSPKLGITAHALERYIERCAVGATAEEAEARLSVEAGLAFPIRRRSRHGHEQWRTPSGAVLVIKRGRGMPATCVTVLTESQALSEGDWT